MRIALAEVRSRVGKVPENLCALEGFLAKAEGADIVALPELYLSGYSIGDRVHQLSIKEGSHHLATLKEIVARQKKWVVVGAPFENPARRGETLNAALTLGPSGELSITGKRYLPTFGPFEEGLQFTPGGDRDVVSTPQAKIGVEICYEVFFPELSRKMALNGAELIVVISASPNTSRSQFEKLLPARAIENATGVAYVNKFGVEDSLVFSGGSRLYDPRGEEVEPEVVDLGDDGRILLFEVHLEDWLKMRPARPVLRDATLLS